MKIPALPFPEFNSMLGEEKKKKNGIRVGGRIQETPGAPAIPGARKTKDLGFSSESGADLSGRALDVVSSHKTQPQVIHGSKFLPKILEFWPFHSTSSPNHPNITKVSKALECFQGICSSHPAQGFPWDLLHQFSGIKVLHLENCPEFQAWLENSWKIHPRMSLAPPDPMEQGWNFPPEAAPAWHLPLLIFSRIFSMIFLGLSQDFSWSVQEQQRSAGSPRLFQGIRSPHPTQDSHEIYSSTFPG